jgi:hypothetical protein
MQMTYGTSLADRQKLISIFWHSTAWQLEFSGIDFWEVNRAQQTGRRHD